MSDPHPDSLPENDNDNRTDIERAVEERGDDADRAGGGSGTEPAGEPGSVGGTDGVTRNQDSDAQ